MTDRKPPASPDTIAVMAELYGITFTEAEIRWLTVQSGLLDPYDRQRAYLLRLALRPEPCPGCKHILCPRSAWTGKSTGEPSGRWPGSPPPPDISWAGDGEDGDLFACPACAARLIHRIGLIQEDHWMELAPGQTVQVSARPGKPGNRS